jgi:NTE family protein
VAARGLKAMGGSSVLVRVAICAAVLGGCASVHNEPVNRPLADNALAPDPGHEVSSYEDDLLVALSFSGGGTRAAAFSYGVLAEMDSTSVRGRTASPSLVDRVDFVSGVSGGSIMAAYFGLKKRAALGDFRERFLLRDAEETLRTRITIANISRALSGGVNDASGFARWLDENLFEGATFGTLGPQRRPHIWINASDIYNRTSFVFGPTAFSAMCSDLASYPIAEAVAASAAVPVVFAPVVIRTYPGSCRSPQPAWMERARRDPAASPMLKAFASAIGHYGDGSQPYIKLMDGGLVDNFGLSGFTIARLSANTPYGPLTPRQAVKLRRALTLVVDAGRGPSGDWTQTVEGPSGPELVVAAADTAMVASVRASFTAFDGTMAEWQSALVRWRCGLSAADRQRLGAPANWNCRDVKFFVARIGFDQLGPERAAELDQVRTSFKLPADTVDTLIAAGREALKANPTYRAFLASL